GRGGGRTHLRRRRDGGRGGGRDRRRCDVRHGGGRRGVERVRPARDRLGGSRRLFQFGGRRPGRHRALCRRLWRPDVGLFGRRRRGFRAGRPGRLEGVGGDRLRRVGQGRGGHLRCRLLRGRLLRGRLLGGGRGRRLARDGVRPSSLLLSGFGFGPGR